MPKDKYADHFCVGEVQQTFYEPPRIPTLERWRAMAPAHFEFTLKAWQLITHTARSPTFRRLKTKLNVEELAQCGSFQDTPIVQFAWERSRDCAKALAARHLLFQCPTSFTPTPANLEKMRRFFSQIERGGLKLLWEPRGEAWPADLVRTLCRELELVHVVDPFVSRTTSSDLIYFRLHGGNDFKHVYSDTELATLLAMTPPAMPAYVMFNNIAMLNDAARLKSLTLNVSAGNTGVAA